MVEEGDSEGSRGSTGRFRDEELRCSISHFGVAPSLVN